jgi:hypothetical protein
MYPYFMMKSTITILDITPSCVESEAIPYELLVITVMIDVGEELKNWDFSFILTGHYRADIACQRR